MKYVRKSKTIFVRSVWVMLSVFFTLLTVFFAVGRSVAVANSAAINSTLGTETTKKIQLGDGDEDMEHYKSPYVKRNDDGSIMYETEENGYKHQVYDDAAMRKNSERIGEQAAVEGSVLLWNNDALPLASGAGVSVFGIASQKYTFSGFGSGHTDVTPSGGMLSSALKIKGFKVNSALETRYSQIGKNYGLNMWTDSAATNYAPHFDVKEVPWSEISDVATSTVDRFGDAAVMIITRNAGEDSDISEFTADTYADGSKNNLELTKEEADVLENLNGMKPSKVKKIILLLNTANPMQFSEIKKDKYGVDACVWVGHGGTMSYVQIADILAGHDEYAVSGHTPDTLAYNNRSAPSYANFGDFTWTDMSDALPDLDKEYGQYYQTHNMKYLVYQEGIYVGYRYYETRYEDYVLEQGKASGKTGSSDGESWNYSKEVAFPFGYGLSYTTFERGTPTFDYDDETDTYSVSMSIKNSGNKYSGKDTLQVYLQKPYTDYDKKTGIEKSAVELVGFAKTDLLKVGGSAQTLTVTVDGESLRTYDSYGQKTYILEKGDYYLAVGTDAHDALNNILAAKGHTRANTNNRMDSDGNADMAYRIHIADDDFEKFAKTDKDVGITNRFDDADLNLYEGTKDDQSITYLSRGDWEGTFPTESVKLKCVNETMVRDMQYGHETPVKEGDELPKYGETTASEGELTIAMLKKLEFDDPKWQDLLNQMSLEEQSWLCSYGLLFFADAESVGAPGGNAVNGPTGVATNNKTLGTQFGIPSPVMLAATFDAPLVEKAGEAFALEALHANKQLVYAPGGNTHRSAYGGRNFEYYSEDGVLSGVMLTAQVRGLQSRGIIVESKHFAFNDQERNRYGVATFFNEQSAREIYLRPFEIAVRNVEMSGIMSSFNRIGCTWDGAHKGLLTDVLRNEWGYHGFVESDACTGDTFHMRHKYAKAEGLIAGNDMWMDNGSKTFFDDSKDNPTVMLALREACHRILYVQLNSCAMNGVSINTVIVRITPWWQTLLTSATAVAAVILGVCAVMTVLSFVFRSKKFGEYIEPKLKAKEAAGKKIKFTNGICNLVTALSITVIIVITTLAVALVPIANNKKALDVNRDKVHICGHVCPDCGLCMSDCEESVCAEKCQGHPVIHECGHVCPECGKCLDYDCTDENCADKCGSGKNIYTFEAEAAAVKDGKPSWGNYHRIVTNSDGRTYIDMLNGNTGATVTFTVDAAQDTVATLSVTVTRFDKVTVFTSLIGVSVNGGMDLVRPTEVDAVNTDDMWTEAAFGRFNLGCIPLQKGKNTIVFTVRGQWDYTGYNFDKIELESAVELGEYHECEHECIVCGKCLSECSDPACAGNRCDGKHEVYEAENAKLTDGAAWWGSIGVETNEAGRTYIKNLNGNKGAKIEFDINATDYCEAYLAVTTTRRDVETKFTEKIGISVNGGEYLDRNVSVPVIDNSGQWMERSFIEINLGKISLKSGVNTLSLTVLTDGEYAGYSIDKITLYHITTVAAPPHVCEHVCPEEGCGKCTDDTCTDPACAEKCPGHVSAPHECGSVCPECGGCLDEDCTESACANKCSEKTYVLEAENAVLVDGSKTWGALEVKTEGNITYIQGANGNTGATITFTFTPDTGVSELNLIVTCTRRDRETTFTETMEVTVNGAKHNSDAIVPAFADQWKPESFTDVNLGKIAVKPGEINTIVFKVTKEWDYSAYNFDKITLVGHPVNS